MSLLLWLALSAMLWKPGVIGRRSDDPPGPTQQLGSTHEICIVGELVVSDPVSAFAEPLLTPPGQPLRVAVYSRIADAIRSHGLLPGGLLPRETELGLALGVSRTVVREALMLLEEDGLITTKRGVGRFVADSIPSQKFGEFRPLEDVLTEEGGTVSAEVVEFTRQTATDFVSEYLELPADAKFWFRECIVSKDDTRVALVQEYLPDESYLATLDSGVATSLHEAASVSTTLLKAITERLGPVFTAGTCRIAASVAGPTRAHQLDVKASDSLLVLTQTAHLGDTPAYVSKCALPPAFGHLEIAQWRPA
ncbi:GntR family transcriptional regulator [Leifsonella bigeumensis]|uniref:GntR family transcriptional regulator n=1 Tax=Leifsonella bigeumensis TaxID=433643 RepID=UPI0031E3C7F3